MNDERAEPPTKPGETNQPPAAGDAPSVGPADTLPLAPPSKRAEDSRLLAGKFGRYAIVRLLGRGGMGEVYLAHDDILQRRVALKVPRTDEALDAETIERFYREARTAARLSHPNLCAVYDVGEIDGRLFLAMPYIAGESLASVLHRLRLTPAQAVGIVVKLALAVDEAHRAGILHRDLKPGNVMLNERGEPVVMDFGLARLHQQHDTRLTMTGAMLGTPAYASPEQLQGDLDAIGPASDVYSLGVMLFEMLTGRMPFEGSLASMMKQVLVDPPPRPSSLAPGIAPPLEAICLRALAKRPAERFATMGELASALQEAGTIVTADIVAAVPLTIQPPVSLPAGTPPIKSKHAVRSNRAALWGCLALLACSLITCSGIVGWIAYYGPDMARRFQADFQRDPNWDDLANFWQPPATMPPDFSKVSLPRYQLVLTGEVAAIPDFDIPLPASHAVYRDAKGEIDVYVARASELETEGIYRKVEQIIQQHDDGAAHVGNVPDYPHYPSTIRSGGPASRYLSFRHRNDYQLPGDAAVFWWDEGWLFLARSSSDAEPRFLLRDLLAAINANANATAAPTTARGQPSQAGP